MALAPVVYCLWQRLRFDPDHPIWPNRDRFVLSVGHASTLLYAMLHLTGVKAVNPKYEVLGELAVSLDDIRRFRQLDSKCRPPEYRWTSGIETTTGPLGQGWPRCGMAIAARWFASYFNRPDFELLDYDVYALAGDGCMEEGPQAQDQTTAAGDRGGIPQGSPGGGAGEDGLADRRWGQWGVGPPRASRCRRIFRSTSLCVMTAMSRSAPR